MIALLRLNYDRGSPRAECPLGSRRRSTTAATISAARRARRRASRRRESPTYGEADPERLRTTAKGTRRAAPWSNGAGPAGSSSTGTSGGRRAANSSTGPRDDQIPSRSQRSECRRSAPGRSVASVSGLNSSASLKGGCDELLISTGLGKPRQIGRRSVRVTQSTRSLAARSSAKFAAGRAAVHASGPLPSRRALVPELDIVEAGGARAVIHVPDGQPSRRIASPALSTPTTAAGSWRHPPPWTTASRRPACRFGSRSPDKGACAGRGLRHEIAASKRGGDQRNKRPAICPTRRGRVDVSPPADPRPPSRGSDPVSDPVEGCLRLKAGLRDPRCARRPCA